MSGFDVFVLMGEILFYTGLALVGTGELIGFLMMDGIYPSSSERKMVLSLFKYGGVCIILAIADMTIIRAVLMN